MKKDFLSKLLNLFDKIGLYIFALAVVALNISLAFDNVMWGDECFSANVVKEVDWSGLLQRIYYWDSHPPLYYMWVKLFSDIFGRSVCVFHFASLVPFVIVIVLACTYIKSKLGAIPAAFFVLGAGLFGPCASNNQEVRMYSLAFLFSLCTAIFSYRIICEKAKIVDWIMLTIFAEMGAYTHYFSTASLGILVFFTSLLYFLLNCKTNRKSWMPGCFATIAYIILYIPWIPTFISHATREDNWWMSSADGIDSVLGYMFGGFSIKPFLFPIMVVLTVLIFVIESKMIYLKQSEERTDLFFKLRKPDFSELSQKFLYIVLLWVTIAGLLLFAYGLGWIIGPIMITRYSYPLIPFVLLILAVEMEIALERVMSACPYKKTDDIRIRFENKAIGRVITIVAVSLLFVVLLFFSLRDFRMFRSVSRVENEQIEKVFTIIGSPERDVLIVGKDDPHFEWSVLPYYYPDNTVIDCEYDEVIAEMNNAGSNEVWIFSKALPTDDEVKQYKNDGIEYEYWQNLWLGKYPIALVHLVRGNVG